MSFMRHRMRPIVRVALVAIISLVACEKKPAQISFSQTDIDLGTVYTNDAIHSLDIEFKNRGDEDLVISSVWPSCECVTVERYDTIVAGGKKGKITVNYNFSIYPPGDIERSISIGSNSADTTNHEVFFHATLKYANH